MWNFPIYPPHLATLMENVTITLLLRHFWPRRWDNVFATISLMGHIYSVQVVKFWVSNFTFWISLLTLQIDLTRWSIIIFSGKSYSPEELVGQLLYKAQEYAQNSANQVVTEVVLTVPGFFNDFERRSLITAAELAGLKVLQLINDYSAGNISFIYCKKLF